MWTSPDGQHWNQIDYILCSQRWRSSIQLEKTKLLFTKFRLKLKKIGKTTRSFMYDLNQIPYNYTVEVINRFKGLDLINGVLEELWMEVHKNVQEADHLTYLLRNLYAGQEATVRTGHGTTDWFQIGKGVRQGCILSPCLFNLYAEHIMRNAGLEKAQLESRLPGEISITSDMQVTPPLWQTV